MANAEQLVVKQCCIEYECINDFATWPERQVLTDKFTPEISLPGGRYENVTFCQNCQLPMLSEQCPEFLAKESLVEKNVLLQQGNYVFYIS